METCWRSILTGRAANSKPQKYLDYSRAKVRIILRDILYIYSKEFLLYPITTSLLHLYYVKITLSKFCYLHILI